MLVASVPGPGVLAHSEGALDLARQSRWAQRKVGRQLLPGLLTE